MSVEALLEFAFGESIAPWQIRSEIQRLVEMVAKYRPRVVLEIGTARGGTLFLWTRLAHPEATIFSIDLPGGMFGGGYPRWKMPTFRAFARPGQHTHLLRANSHSLQTFEHVKSILAGRCVDFMFIDGDHTYEGVRRDFELYSPLLAPQGMVAFHDIATEEGHDNYGVARFWHEVKQGRKAIEIVEQPPKGIAGIGVLLAHEVIP
jgi:cephalosporin hydroxylase